MLRSFNNLAGFDALCAYLHTAISSARKLYANGLEIGIKATSGLIIRM